MPADTSQIECERCHAELEVPPDALAEDELKRCAVCRSSDLFIRKDFPQRLGVAIVVMGFFASSVAWYRYEIYLAFGILFTTAAIDIVLYLLVADALVCYRCGAQYRRVGNLTDHGAFELETHERYRQLAARMEGTSSPENTGEMASVTGDSTDASSAEIPRSG